MKKFLLLVLQCLISFAFAQIPNPGFELWDNQPVPLHWQTNSRPLTTPAWEPYIVRQDTERYSGNFAANFYANGIFKAYATTTFPVSYHPQNLSLFYKSNFAPCVNDTLWPDKDTVSIFVELLNGVVVVDSGYWESITTSFNYSRLVIPISQNATAFDSCRITIWGGKVIGGCGIIAASTEFKVDNLELKYSNQSSCIDSSQICLTCRCHSVYEPVCGCDSITYRNSCTAYISGVTSWSSGACVNASCNADFYFIKRIDTVTFNNTSIAAVIDTYFWNFGDGNSSTQQHPTHIYTIDSTYIVCLTIIGKDSIGNNCTDQFCDTILITHGCIDSSQICPPGSLCCDAPLQQPVCGCDSVTYMNSCMAMLFGGVTGYYEGNCVTTGIKDGSSIGQRIFISPNPVKDVMNVKYETAHSGKTEMRITNLLGQEVKFISPIFEISGKHSLDIQVRDLAKGVYVLEIKNEGERRLKKFIID